MGFFSWECAKTRKPILAYMGEEDLYSFASKVIVLFENGDRFTGNYNGYGMVRNDNNVSVDLTESTGWKMVIERYYEGENFTDLEDNRNEPRQGYFWDEFELFSIFSK